MELSSSKVVDFQLVLLEILCICVLMYNVYNRAMKLVEAITYKKRVCIDVWNFFMSKG